MISSDFDSFILEELTETEKAIFRDFVYFDQERDRFCVCRELCALMGHSQIELHSFFEYLNFAYILWSMGQEHQ